MTVKTLVFNPFMVNTYLIFDESKDAIIVDPACYNPTEAAQLKKAVDENGLNVKYIVNTHCHVDHILGVEYAKNLFECKWLAHPEELQVLESAPSHAQMFGFSIDKIPIIDKTINDGEVILFGNSEFTVIATPGHTPGGICLYSANEGILISGDTLFKGSVGRTDLEGGDYEMLMESVQKLKNLPSETIVFPGHGPSSTIGEEVKQNPFLK
ncbi:MAG TPA: MBL fold metallo-hydrolase [Tenuifilaceae bacterium]|nr:MBL fold metallo-hydrolase [Tenuifilaceae bacterium]